jgi:hypothetical protein
MAQTFIFGPSLPEVTAMPSTKATFRSERSVQNSRKGRMARKRFTISPESSGPPAVPVEFHAQKELFKAE